MSDPFIAEIIMFGGNFAPRGWSYCNGQLLPINQHSALFSLLGTTYGGDGRTTLALPDLRGRVPVHSGGNSAGPGLTARRLGARSGQETVTLTANQIPPHGHSASTATANRTSPQSNFPAVANDGESNYQSDTNTTSPPSGGGGQAHDNMPPYLAVNFIIALQGVFPSRS